MTTKTLKGRPKLPDTAKKKSCNIVTRFSEADFKALKEVAESHGFTVSGFIRMAVKEKIYNMIVEAKEKRVMDELKRQKRLGKI